MICFAGAVYGLAQAPVSFDAVDLDAQLSLDRLATRLAAKRVVFIGETHDRYDHHLNQLEIIRQLYRTDPNLAIGVEYLQRPSQQAVDDYIAGKITEDEFLRASRYFQSWGYDYRLYAPIFRFAREQHIPIRALNVPGSLPSAVAKSGISGLSPEQSASLPQEIVPADDDYKSRLRPAFEAHGSAKPGAFDHFVEAQLVWDEGMAESAAGYLNANPGRRLVILAGSGHVVFGAGIPMRLERRTHASYAVVLSSGEDVEPGIADFLVLSKTQNLPPAGVLGVLLQDKSVLQEKSRPEKQPPGKEDAGCAVRSVTPDGAAAKAGIKKGDILLQVDGRKIDGIADLRIVLWDKKPGDQVQLAARHGRGSARTYAVELTAPAKPAGK